MDAIGAKLSGAREAKGVSIEQAARDTHIAKRFIEALEREDFDLFPGEVYLLGFIRSYSGYLGLDSEDIISLYHNIRLQEQPAPIDELLDRRPSREGMVKFVIIGVAALLIVGAVILLSASGIVSIRRATSEEPAENPIMEALVLNEQFVERRFVEGSIVAVPLDGEQALLEFVSIGERVAVGSDAGIVQLDVGEERMLDITGEGSGDVSLVIRQIYGEEMPPAVVARVDRIVVGQPVSAVPPPAELTEADRTELALGRTAEPRREREPVVVAQFAAPQEYFIEADFRGFTMFRWEIDELPREERYLQNGDRVRAGVRDTARIWTSNAGNVRMRVAGNPIELGRQGEVVAVMLRWNAAVDGGFQLELLPLY